MATGSLDANGIWQYGEDDSEATASALLNKLAASTSTQIGKRKILQVVSSSNTTGISTTSTAFVNTNVTATITPTSATSKILILVDTVLTMAGSSNLQINYTIFRGTIAGTNLGNGASGFGRFYHGGTASQVDNSVAIHYLDSPGTTSAQQYMLAINRGGGTTVGTNPAANRSTMTLIEVSA
jgi:hypothetical protein